MIPLSEVGWGPTNAVESDPRFSDKWVEPDEIKECLNRDTWIVTGEKGSGKSAIQRAMREIHKDDYFVCPLIDFDKITFGALFENVVQLSTTTQLSNLVTLSNYWQYSIIVEMLRACVEHQPDIYGDLLRTIPKNRRTDTPINSRLLSLLEEAWNLIDDFTAARQPRQTSRKANMLASGGLSADLLHNLSTFPLGKQYEAVKAEFFARLDQHKHNVTLVLDGFDTLITQDAKPGSIQLIFSSLIDAILALRADESLPQGFSIKALLPHDRYLNMTLRDSDKVDSMHTAIRWNSATLREFIRKRIETTTKLKSSSFMTLWRQVFPEKITDPFYAIEEDSFDYLLRHTMMRPRQLQIHLQGLSKQSRGRILDPSEVPRSIATSTEQLAKYWVDEYGLDHPHLEKFVLTFEGRENITEYSKFRDHVVAGLNRVHGLGHTIDIDDHIDSLFAMGMFGVLKFANGGDSHEHRYYPPTRESRRHYVEFFYRRPYTKVSSRLSDDSPVALHPIFTSFANLTLHPTLIVG
jgi:hypothetical protein